MTMWSAQIIEIGAVILVSSVALIAIIKMISIKRTYQDAGDPYKLYCIVSREAVKLMNGNRGKMIAQGGHAFVHALEDSKARFPKAARAYLGSGNAYKIALEVDTTDELIALEALYKERFGTALIKDAARTVFKQPTITCLGIGPIRESQREDILKGLNPFK